jgi:hypothetical protein
VILVLLSRSLDRNVSAVTLIPAFTYNLAAVLLKALVSSTWLCTPNYIPAAQPDRFLLALINVRNQYVQLSERGALACWNALHCSIVYIIIEPLVSVRLSVHYHCSGPWDDWRCACTVAITSTNPALPKHCYVGRCPLLQLLYLINTTFRQLAPVPSSSVHVSLQRHTCFDCLSARSQNNCEKRPFAWPCLSV